MNEKKVQSLEELLTSMSSTIEAQTVGSIRVGTVLVDLTQELGLVIRDLIERAEKSREDLLNATQQIALHRKLGSQPEEDDPVIENAWTAVGQVNAYLYAVTELRNLCKNVMGRKDVTKH